MTVLAIPVTSAGSFTIQTRLMTMAIRLGTCVIIVLLMPIQDRRIVIAWLSGRKQRTSIEVISLFQHHIVGLKVGQM